MIFAVTGLSYLKSKRWFTMPDARSFFTVSAVLAFASANFMTTSVKAYVPLCPDVRHYLFVVPIAAVAAAFVLQDLIEQKRFAPFLLIVFAAASVWSFANGFEHKFLYASIAVVVLLRWLLPIVPRVNTVALVTVVLLLCVGPLRDGLVNRNNGYADQKALVHHALLPLQTQTVVITDVVQKHFGEYAFGFDSAAPVRFVEFRELSSVNIPSTANCMLLSNGMTRWMSATDWESLPDLAKHEERLTTVAARNDVKLYRVDRSALP
jgi:hypothetical protein